MHNGRERVFNRDKYSALKICEKITTLQQKCLLVKGQIQKESIEIILIQRKRKHIFSNFPPM